MRKLTQSGFFLIQSILLMSLGIYSIFRDNMLMVALCMGSASALLGLASLSEIEDLRKELSKYVRKETTTG